MNTVARQTYFSSRTRENLPDCNKESVFWLKSYIRFYCKRRVQAAVLNVTRLQISV